MVVLKFKNKEQANAVVGVIDFSINLLDEKEAKKINESIYLLVLSIKENLIYQQDENILFVKDEEVEFVFENAIWILGEELKVKENLVYSNSIGLMKEVLFIIKEGKQK